jgi:hypothetical protein
VLTLSFSENATAWRRADDDDDGGGGDDYACVRGRCVVLACPTELRRCGVS